MSGGFMLDAGALIAIDRGDRRMLALLEAARDAGLPLSATAPTVGQAWRGGRRQARPSSQCAKPAQGSSSVARGVNHTKSKGSVVVFQREPYACGSVFPASTSAKAML